MTVTNLFITITIWVRSFSCSGEHVALWKLNLCINKIFYCARRGLLLRIPTYAWFDFIPPETKLVSYCTILTLKCKSCHTMWCCFYYCLIWNKPKQASSVASSPCLKIFVFFSTHSNCLFSIKVVIAANWLIKIILCDSCSWTSHQTLAILVSFVCFMLI